MKNPVFQLPVFFDPFYVLTIGFLLCGFSFIPAQTPTNQDCAGSIALCQFTYSETNAYMGTGNILNEIDTNNSCLKSGERNDVWYTFTVSNPGNLCFTITPNVAADDYDWAVYNLSSASCGDISSNPSLEVSCNYAPNPGPTGPNGLGGPQNEPCLSVNTGERYVINVSQFSVSLNGYTVDFSASTATIYDNTIPALDTILTSISCGANSISFSLTEEIVCASVSPSDFQINGPGGPYTFTSLTGTECSSGSQLGQTFSATVSPPLKYGGSFNLCINGSVTDLCGNSAAGSCLPFTISGVTAVIISSTDVNCFHQKTGTATADASNGVAPYTFQWSTVPPQFGPVATGLGGGNYAVTATDAAGCAGVTSVTITQPVVLPSIDPVSCDSFSCDGQASVLPVGGTPPYSYQWYDEQWNPIPGETNPSVNNLCAGPWFIVTTDNAGCKDTTAITIQIPALGVAQVSPSCPGDCDGKALLASSGGTPPFTYQWENPLGTPIAGETDTALENVCAGWYYIRVTTVSGCVLTDSIQVIDPPPLNVTAVPENTCAGVCDGRANAAVTGGTSPYSYQWDTPDSSTTAAIVSLCAGTYAVTVTDSKGCTATSSTTITETTPMTLTTSVVNTNCSQPDGIANVLVSGGTSPYTYQWNDDNSQTTQSATGLPARDYSVIVTDNIGCKDTATVSVGYADSNVAVITVNKPISCPGACDGEIEVAITGGVPPYTYSWSTKDITASVDSACADTISVTATDSTGCPAASQILLQDPLPITIDNMTPTPETSCNSQDGSIDISVSGGNPAYTYQWSTGATSQDITGLTAGTYTVTVYDSNNCPPDTGTTVLTEPPRVDINVISTTPESTCNSQDGSIDIDVVNGEAPYTYQWSTGAATQDVSGLSSGSFTVIVTDVNNCPADTEIIVLTEPPPIVSDVTVQNLSCTGSNDGSAITAVQSGGEAPYTYIWSTGQSGAANFVTGLTVGTYTVSVTDANQCPADTNTFVITEPPPLASSMSPICEDTKGTADLSVTGGTPPYTYSWSNGAVTEDLLSVPLTGYSVTITDANGCTTTNEVLFTRDMCEIFVPTTFTPNGNGTNDEWEIENLSLYSDCIVKIFNRWGDVVYRSKGYDKPWEGKYLGMNLPVAVYYYIITIPSINTERSGTVTLIR
ncbi:MAG: gliding motility-associated C-terminal domain-containing protein [Bacteroidetes bacterium]|nr:gliding motility-associated C-terminal domain-containing protein [Bacteroidota bacterium]